MDLLNYEDEMKAMNHNITYDEDQIRRDACTAKVKEILKDKTDYSKEIAIVCAAESQERKVSDLAIAELYELIIKAIKECKRQYTEQSEAEYQKLTCGKIPKEW